MSSPKAAAVLFLLLGLTLLAQGRQVNKRFLLANNGGGNGDDDGIDNADSADTSGGDVEGTWTSPPDGGQDPALKALLDASYAQGDRQDLPGNGNIKKGDFAQGGERRSEHFSKEKDDELKGKGKGKKFQSDSGAACPSVPCYTCTQGGYCPINYYGGPTIFSPTAATKIFYVFYGSTSYWSAARRTLLKNLATGLAGSPYLSINNWYYYQNAGFNNGAPYNLTTTSSNPIVTGTTVDAYSQGTRGTLYQSNIEAILTRAFSRNLLPVVDNAVYFVLTSPDVKIYQFCTQMCGYHSMYLYNNVYIKYAFVGNAATQCPGSCIASSNVKYSPNNDVGIDGMASVLAHELEEALSDPNPGYGWAFANGQENADMCAWTFGATKPLSNGAQYNVDLGIYGKWLIQQNWINDPNMPNGGACGLQLPS